MGTSASRPVTIQVPKLGPPKFPDSINLYYSTAFSGIKITIGEHKSSPLYAANVDSNWSGTLTMYSGPSEDYPAIATADFYYPHSYGSSITVADLRSTGNDVIREHFEQHNSVFTRGKSFTFTAFVTDATGYHSEKFRWCKDGGGGWKLVNLNGEQEGDEVFAFWAPCFFLKVSKGATLRFVGRGATGEMGDFFTLMVVVTWLRSWQARMKAERSVNLAT